MHTVVVYSTSTCPHCHTLKNYLKEKGIVYTDYNVAADRVKADEMIKKSGQMGIPVAEIDGKIVIGFDREKINELLGLFGDKIRPLNNSSICHCEEQGDEAISRISAQI